MKHERHNRARTQSEDMSQDLELEWHRYRQDARVHECHGRIDAAWACLEAAHIVGQRVTRLHARSHALMLGLAWRTADVREVVGQTARWIASVAVTWLWVPEGNTGRANVSAFQRMPIPRDLGSP